MSEGTLRESIVDTCRRMNTLGINQGTSGNVSARYAHGMLISPSGLAYEEMDPADIVFVASDGTVDGTRAPSSEWRFHRDILAADESVGAVVHTHATYCTVLAIRRMEIPPLHYMIAAAGGANIRCAEYATFGTEALSRNVLEALTDRRACLIANHGMLATGESLARALWLAVEVEALARQYVLALQIGGPHLLTDSQIAEARAQFSGYGLRTAG